MTLSRVYNFVKGLIWAPKVPGSGSTQYCISVLWLFLQPQNKIWTWICPKLQALGNQAPKCAGFFSSRSKNSSLVKISRKLPSLVSIKKVWGGNIRGSTATFNGFFLCPFFFFLCFYVILLTNEQTGENITSLTSHVLLRVLKQVTFTFFS